MQASSASRANTLLNLPMRNLSFWKLIASCRWTQQHEVPSASRVTTGKVLVNPPRPSGAVRRRHFSYLDRSSTAEVLVWMEADKDTVVSQGGDRGVADGVVVSKLGDV